MRVLFGKFVLDHEKRQLLKGQRPIHLTPKAYQLLTLLVDAQPRALSKEELQQSLWPSTFVDEANLSVLVAEVRAALDDDARQPRFVRTVHGYGYAFVEVVTRDARDTRRPVTGSLRDGWWLVSDQGQIRLRDGDNVVGRELSVDVWLDSGSVSRRHAQIVIDGDQVSVEDLSSKNGTWVNGRRIETRETLHKGDEIRFGSATVRLHWGVEGYSTESMSPI